MTLSFSAHIKWSAYILCKILLLLLLNSQIVFIKYYMSAVNYAIFDWIKESVSFSDISITKKETFLNFRTQLSSPIL